MIRDPLDPGTTELHVPVEVAPFGNDVPRDLIAVDDQLDWAVAIARFNQLADGAYARNSVRAYRADWKVWTDYCRKHEVRVLPATPEQIKGFLEEGIAAHKKRSTLDRYVATLALAHRAARLPNPLDDIDGMLVLRAFRRNTKLRQRRKMAKGLGWAFITQILDVLDPDSAKDARDAALLCLGYDTFGRLSELIGYRWEDLSVEPDGSGRIYLQRSKTDQEGKGKYGYVSPDTVAWLERWRSLAGLSEGFVFRAMRRGSEAEAPLGERDVPRILKRLALRGGIAGAVAVSGHSLRVGKDQDAVAAGHSLAAIMEGGGWKSPVMPARYAEMLEAGRGVSAQLAAKQGRT